MRFCLIWHLINHKISEGWCLNVYFRDYEENEVKKGLMDPQEDRDPQDQEDLQVWTVLTV